MKVKGANHIRTDNLNYNIFFKIANFVIFKDLIYCGRGGIGRRARLRI